LKRNIVGIPVLLLAIAALSGCQAFFTTSFASGLKRTSVNVPADISNADAAEILDGEMKPSDEMLSSLLAVLNNQAAAGNTGSAKLAAEAAVDLSGVSETLGAILKSQALPSDPSALIDAFVAGYTETGVSTALLALDDPAIAKALGPDDLLVAAVLLASSKVESYGINLNDPGSSTDLSGYQNDDSVKLAVILIQDAVDALPVGSSISQLVGDFTSFFPME